MFEGAIAAFLNRLLGKYIEDLDTEQFNVGIFSGDTCLTDLKLKPEALYQLGLPIRVEVGLIGKIILKIPWSGLFSQPIVLCIEDIYIVAVSALSGPYDPEVQKKLIRAEKKKVLEDLQGDEIFKAGLSSELFDSLLASITKNFQITINNVHIRYEEKLSNKSLCACGICIQSVSITTTNNKWKPGICASNSHTVYQLIRAESLSVYMDHDTESSLRCSISNWDLPTLLAWKGTMHRALQTFGMRNREFQFLLNPFTAKIKLIIHKGTESLSSRMLVDIVLQDVAMQISEEQYITFCQLYDSLLRAMINRPHRKFRPDKNVHENSSEWWKYAYNAVVEYNIRPYTWAHIVEHRKNYRKYKEACLQNLLRPYDTELKLDMQKYEDSLTILNIIIAREQAKQELRNTTMERECESAKRNSLIYETMDNILSNANEVQNTVVDNKEQDSKNVVHYVNNESGRNIKLEKLSKPIDYKFNFTLANCCLSLLRTEKEVLVITITQFLTSIETQPALPTFKVSARAESFVIEGVSMEGDLVPLITVDNVLTGNVSTNFLAIDFEKNGLHTDSTIDVSLKLEAIEMIYYHHAAMEITNFFKFDDVNVRATSIWLHRLYKYMKEKIMVIVDDIVSQTLRINFKIDIKGPYIVFHEHGTIQKGGHILVLDFGNVNISNELQATNLQLEDATLMELEELLYDRIHMIFTGGQVLFCHSGDDWRTARKRKDSEYHFIPKIHANATVSYSIKPEYHQLPRTKVNVTISSIKFNLTENKLRLIMQFLNTLIMFYQKNIVKYRSNVKWYISKKTWDSVYAPIKELARVRASVCLPPGTASESKFMNVTKEFLTSNIPKLDRSVVSSEVSEEDLELLSKTINLSGFDDNVSPCNHINLLLRFAIGELSVHLSCISSGKEHPYLNLRLHTLYIEAAMMEYGPAIQFGIGSILLVDKTNVGVTGSYLELIYTNESNEVLVVSYRKVQSNCPDFKSHFKSIERSLVVNILNINVNFHRPALLKLKEYWYNLSDIFHSSCLLEFIDDVYNGIVQWKIKENDPPIPPGAIKLNYSARLGKLILRFCDKDTDLMEIKVLGLENDCIYNANERMILQAHLRNLLVEDLNDDTLYAKILTTDEDKVFDLKYVRHIPRLYVCPEIDTRQDDVMSDGTFKFSIGRMNCVLISKILQDLQHFLTPFTSTYCTQLKKYLYCKFMKGIDEFKKSATKLHIFIDIQGPTFLLPQRKDVPSLLVLNTGILSVENFFKKIDQPAQPIKVCSSDASQLIIDNILVKLKCMSISRAIMTLSRDLEVQEPIIEPVHIHFDIKRKTEYRSMMEFQTYGLFSIQGSMDFIYVNLSQRDLKSIILVWSENISKIILSKESYEHEEQCSMENQLRKPSQEDVMVKELEDFLAHNEVAVCEVSTKTTLEGVQLNLFLDAEEVLSSPVRDLNRGLCKLKFGEIINSFDFYSDKSLKMKLSLQSCMLQDTRKNSNLVKKIIQSPARLIGNNLESWISVSMSPIVDIAYTRAPAGERCFDILMQDMRLNLSVPFVMHLSRYIMDCFPCDQVEAGIINHGYESNNHATSRTITTTERDKLKRAQYLRDEPDTSVSIRIQKPEILLFGDLKGSNAYIILLQAEVTIESSRHNCSSSVVCTLTDVRAKCRNQGNYLRQFPKWLLRPCDIEICKKEESPECNVNVTIAVNTVDLHLCAGVMHTFIDILNEATSFLDSTRVKSDDTSIYRDYNPHSNLWTPKKVSNIPYKKLDECDPDLYPVRNTKFVTVDIKPICLTLWIEMEYSFENLPIIRIATTIATTINDWYKECHLESSIKIHAFCYNGNCKSWEPLIDLCTKDDVHYKPWELNVKICHGEPFMINPNWTNPCQQVKQNVSKIKRRDLHNSVQGSADMVFISPESTTTLKTTETESYSAYEEDSDTDEEESYKKLARTSNYIFNNNSSGEEESDTDDSSANEDEGLELTPDYNMELFSPIAQKLVKTDDPAMYIIIMAEDKLNFTFTQNTITIINAVLNAFIQAKSGIPIVPTNVKKLNLQNGIGHASRIELLCQEEVNGKNVTRIVAFQDFHCSNSPPSVPSSPELEVQSDLISPQWVENEIDISEPNIDLQKPIISDNNVFNNNAPINIYKTITSDILHVIFEGFEDLMMYCPKRQGCNIVPLRPVRHDVRYHLIVEASIDTYFHQTILVRSPLQFCNETSYALGLYCKKSLVKKLGLTYIGEPTNPFDDYVRMTIIEPDCIYNIPLYIAYHFPVHILPVYLGMYQISDEGIYWKDLSVAANAVQDIYCNAKTAEDHSVFSVKVSCKEIPLRSQPSCQVPNYLISIIPPLIFNNQLPFVIDLNIPSINYEVKIEPGEKINMHTISCKNDIQFAFKIQNYLGTFWTGSIKLNTNMEKKFILMSTENESNSTKSFLLCIELSKVRTWNIVIQSQYWIINKCGLPLFIQEYHSRVTHEVPEEELMVFSQKNNKKNTVRLRAHQSEWSLPFGLDGIIPMSLVVCMDIERRRKYRILVEIESSRLSPYYTKIITFLPYFFIINKTKRTLRFMEENDEADLWNDLLPGQNIPFWPVTESMKMRIKWRNSQLVSQHFDITTYGRTVLRMDNGSALCVDIDGGVESPYCIMFQKYLTGDSPVRIDNLCNELFLKINQMNLGQTALLNPFQSLLYTWDDPTKSRELVWNVYNNKTDGYRVQIESDGCGHEMVPLETVDRPNDKACPMKMLVNVKSTWTEDTFENSDSDNNCDTDIVSVKLERSEKGKTTVYWVSYMECNQRVLLFTQQQSVFLKAKSIIDPEPSKKEIFFSLAGVGISIVGNYNGSSNELLYANITDSTAHWELYFGRKWKSLSLELSAWIEHQYANSSSRAQLENFIDVDLMKMHMTKPFFGKLRRTYSPGIWCHCRKSVTLTHLQGHIHQIQVDNQLTDAVFPVILHSNLQKGFVNYGGNCKLKHCIEFSLLKQKKIKHNIYKGICVIVKEFNLNVQEGFLLSLIDLLPKQPETKHSIATKLRRDITSIHVSSFPKCSNALNGRKKDIIESMYISPIMVRLKLLAEMDGPHVYSVMDDADRRNAIRFIFEYAEKGGFEKQADFRLPFYKKASIVTDNKQFFINLFRTYAVQIIQQFQVLVRSTIVLGNQYGYNFKLLGDTFYEPDTLLLHGDETTEKLGYEVACQLGYATTEIMQTSSIMLHSCEAKAGHNKAKELYFDNTDVPPLVFFINNSFSTEIELETSSLLSTFTNSIHQEELKYFFKTLGKKTSVFFNIEDNSLKVCSKVIADIIKRAQEIGHKFISRIRLPRYINPYTGVEVFSMHKAKGVHLLNTLVKNHCSNTNTYWAHAALSNDGKYIALVSLQRLYLIEKGSTWGSWSAKWSIEMNQLLSPPTVSNNKLILHVNKSEEASSPVADWYLESELAEILDWLCQKINTAMILNMENSICSQQDL
ncbi:hypothetical protein KM043_018296 [Ampulex compressa]|nr:hypothetical protein KM043_018296 [Ampulex compressa]